MFLCTKQKNIVLFFKLEKDNVSQLGERLREVNVNEVEEEVLDIKQDHEKFGWVGLGIIVHLCTR